ncbi:MAG: 2-dehydropantoate 2-reductase, partial [Anaerovorax sp.]
TGASSVRISAIAQLFNEVGLETEISQNVVGLVWDKLLVNVGINALTAITKLENGKLIGHKELEEVLEKAVTEGAQVAKAKGVQLGFSDPVQHTKEVCKATAANKSSMFQDILNNKKTEIDMINGAIVREGMALGIETPVNLVLMNLIKFLEKE